MSCIETQQLSLRSTSIPLLYIHESPETYRVLAIYKN